MSFVLLDANVLYALVWPNHQKSATVQHYLKTQGCEWATCPTTESALFRLSTNPIVNETGMATAGQVRNILSELCRRPGHRFIAESVSLKDLWDEAATSRFQGYRQVTDFYLTALARYHGGKLLTYDRGLTRSTPWPESVVCLSTESP